MSGNGGDMKIYSGDLKIYSVYLVDPRTNKIALIGKLVERRKSERDHNAADMLRLAKKMYQMSSLDINMVICDEDSRPESFLKSA